MPSTNGAVVHQRPSPDPEAYRERQEKVRHLQKEAFQLANYYFVFQGLIFTAFYSGPHSNYNHVHDVRCRYRWVPLTLSSLAGFINLYALVELVCSYKHTLNDIDRVATANNGGSYPIAVRLRRGRRLIFAWVCLALFAVFFVVTIVGCYNITCAHTATAAA